MIIRHSKTQPGRLAWRHGAIAMGMVGMLALAGCAAPDASVEGDVSGKVTFWVNPILGEAEEASWEPVVAAFEKEYPEVTVDVVVQPWANRDQQLTAAITGGQGPDVAYMNDFQVPVYASQGALADLTGLLGDGESDFPQNILDSVDFEGTTYAVPVLTSVTTMIVNRDVMEAVGITEAEYPETWDDVLALAPKIKDAGYYVTQFESNSSSAVNMNFYPFLWQAGGAVLTEDQSAAAFNSPEGEAALTFLSELMAGGYIPADPIVTPPTDEFNAIAQGKTAFSFATEASLLEQWGLTPDQLVVRKPLAGVQPASYGTVGTLVVLEGSKNQPAARAFVEWMAQPDQLAAFNSDRGYYSPRISQTDLYGQDSLAGQQGQFVEYMFPGVLNPKSNEIETILIPHIQSVLLGKATPAEALAAAEEEVNQALARN